MGGEGTVVAKAISAAEANRSFSAVLREVAGGGSYIVTSHGRAVARILPFQSGDRAREAAREALFDRLANAPAASVGRWTRDELHER